MSKGERITKFYHKLSPYPHHHYHRFHPHPRPRPPNRNRTRSRIIVVVIIIVAVSHIQSYISWAPSSLNNNIITYDEI